MMNRSYLAKCAAKSTDTQELCRKTAIHEAGHATAIYIGNKHRQLPPVCFQLLIYRQHHRPPLPPLQWFAKVDGGRLIHTLPSSVAEATHKFSDQQKNEYIKAFEADMVNLLVGPLAEANYIALRDDEIINSRLVNINALHHYGGTADLQMLEDYLACFGLEPEAQEQKMSEIFAAAFNFINERNNWRAIIGLASHILATNQEFMDCGEIMAILDAHSGARQKAA